MGEIALLAELRDRLPSMAREYGLQLVPAVPEDHPGRADVDAAVMTPEEFCSLARAAGARVLFHLATAFNAEAFLTDVVDEDDGSAGSLAEHHTTGAGAVARIRRRARRRDGQIEELQLCAVLDGIAVFWSRQAQWAAELVAEADKLHDQDGDVEQIHARRGNGEQEEITRIANMLQDAPAFREAKDSQARRRAADRLVPRPDEKDYEAGRIRWRAIDQATHAIDEAADAVYSGYMSMLPDLADELLASGALDGARTIPARKIHLKEFLRKRSGGYAPPVDLITLMMDLPQLRDPSGAKAAAHGR